MSRFTRGLGVATFLIGAVVPAPALAQAANQYGPTLEVHLRILKRAGGVSMTGFVDSMLVPGTPATFLLNAGSSNPAEMTVCGGGVADSGSVANKLSRSSFVWEVKMLPSKFENGTATFDLEWARYQADSGVRPAAEGKTTLTLREGDRQPIDFVRGVAGSRNCADEAAVVEVGAGYKENPQIALQVLQYDVWLKHQRTDGQTITRRFTAMGRQGGDVDFVFAPLQFTIATAAPDQSAYDLYTTVQGTIRGRLLPNGRIAVAVDTSRRDGIGTTLGGPSGGSGNGGRKVFDVAADEAIEIELPAPGGFSSHATRPGGAMSGTGAGRASSTPPRKQAVTVENGRVTIDNALFFQGQRTSLIVQVKPVRQ